MPQEVLVGCLGTLPRSFHDETRMFSNGKFKTTLISTLTVRIGITMASQDGSNHQDVF